MGNKKHKLKEWSISETSGLMFTFLHILDKYSPELRLTSQNKHGISRPNIPNPRHHSPKPSTRNTSLRRYWKRIIVKSYRKINRWNGKTITEGRYEETSNNVAHASSGCQAILVQHAVYVHRVTKFSITVGKYMNSYWKWTTSKWIS